MDAKTIKTYNENATEYDAETTVFWDTFPQTFIDTFVQHLSYKSLVLNVGSGPGRDGLILKEKGFTVKCLDASPTMVEITLKKGLDSEEGDMLHLPYKDKNFDAVWAYTSLLHLQKKEFPNALKEINRVLKNRGVFALGMIEGEGEHIKESYGIDSSRLFSYYTKSELIDYLQSEGFKILHEESFKPHTKNFLNFIVMKDN